MSHMTRPVIRHALTQLRAAVRDTPVVVVTGPRQAGKSTLVRQLIDGGFAARYVTLDDSAVRAAAQADPEAFLSDLGSPLVIDEAQRAPALALAIKAAVDRRRTAGRYVLTGSADVTAMLADALVGRMEAITLWPLSQGELEGRRERFVDDVFAVRLPSASGSADLRRDAFRRALRGGFPEVALTRAGARREAWYRSYVASVVDREIRDMSRIEELAELPRMLALVAGRATDALNVSEVARALDMNKMTVSRYLALLERVYLVRRVRSWTGDIGRRVLQHPKLLIPDSGLLAHLLEVDLSRAMSDGRVGGAIIENFVLGEIERQLTWSRGRPSLYYLRTYDGHEIDAVLERRSGELVGIEIKSGLAVDESDFAPLRAFASRVGARFRRGIVLYAGRESVAFGQKLHALPLSALWSFTDQSAT